MVGAVAGKDLSHRRSDSMLLGSRRGGEVGREASTMGLHVGRGLGFGIRHIWILPPAQMGRRSAKIATRKVMTLTSPSSASVFTVQNLGVIFPSQIKILAFTE